ncbi:MAG: hypothetical protein ABMB14_29160 [Myxococcota bacterium]
MPRIATVSLRDHLDDGLLAELAMILCRSRGPGFVDGGDRLVPEPELEPFLDWDIRGLGLGYFRTDPGECATRRVDLRGPTDLDPGPLPMEEAPDPADGELLAFDAG